MSVRSHDRLQTPTTDLDQARSHIVETALTPAAVGAVGLELELHLVDLAAPMRRPGWAEIGELLAAVPPLPGGSSVTVEPGGQVELSTRPAPDVGAAVEVLEGDLAVVRTTLAGPGFGLAALGADPARPSQRVHPGGRYVAMQQHFTAMGCGDAGLAMMASTAGLQVNLNAGPASGWAERLRRLHQLGPVLLALSASSPWLAGRTSGWASMRQQAWSSIDPTRTRPVHGEGAPTSDPARAWADYALSAPVMAVLGEGPVVPVTDRVTLAGWPSRLAGRAVTLHDVDFHLTTLFPPIRPRGYLELRCLDAVGARWWPMLAAVTATLADDAVLSDRAAELCDASTVPSWERAARHGLADDRTRTLAVALLHLAGDRIPTRFAADVDDYLAMVAGGGSPAATVAARIAEIGPAAVLQEDARA